MAVSRLILLPRIRQNPGVEYRCADAQFVVFYSAHIRPGILPWNRLQLISRYSQFVLYNRSVQILDARSPERLNFIQWCFIFLDPRCQTWIMSHFWHLEFWDVFLIL